MSIQQTQRVLEICDKLGFARAGVTAVRPTDHEPQLRDWLDAGKHGEMGYLADQLAERLDPERVLPGVRSVVMVADRYSTRDDDSDAGSPAEGRIARYARGRDYHKVIKKRLHTLADTLREELGTDHGFRSFVDTAPVLEREHAARAGLGWVGKHTLVIHPELGSYLLLGGIYTTIDLPEPEDQSPTPDHCGTCTRCIDACPTDAITLYSVDATRCISYLTLEHRSPIDEDLMPGMDQWIAGCDICQDVCPHNSPRPKKDTGRVNDAYRSDRGGLPLLDVLHWQDDDRRQAFQASALKRIKLDMLKRNAAIAAGNALRDATLDPSTAKSLRTRLIELASDGSEPDMVRQAAAWATRRPPA